MHAADACGCLGGTRHATECQVCSSPVSQAQRRLVILPRVQGQKLGTCAYVRELRRDRSGEFRVEEAWQLDDLVDRAWERGLPRYQDRKMKTVHESVAAETSKVGEASTAEGLSADTESSRAHAVA